MAFDFGAPVIGKRCWDRLPLLELKQLCGGRFVDLIEFYEHFGRGSFGGEVIVGERPDDPTQQPSLDRYDFDFPGEFRHDILPLVWTHAPVRIGISGRLGTYFVIDDDCQKILTKSTFFEAVQTATELMGMPWLTSFQHYITANVERMGGEVFVGDSYAAWVRWNSRGFINGVEYFVAKSTIGHQAYFVGPSREFLASLLSFGVWEPPWEGQLSIALDRSIDTDCVVDDFIATVLRPLSDEEFRIVRERW